MLVADSEADIYELLVAAQAEPQSLDWIVRGCQNRAVERGTGAADDTGDVLHRLREQVATEPVRFTQTIHVRGRRTKCSPKMPPRRTKTTACVSPSGSGSPRRTGQALPALAA
ncbi:MAG TPA: hypothetical protein VHZ24_18080 [Pirellulales bacterium]|nr:hypothetical protein [Pirellulales bacterium]